MGSRKRISLASCSVQALVSLWLGDIEKTAPRGTNFLALPVYLVDSKIDSEGQRKLSGKEMQVLPVGRLVCTKEIREGEYGQESIGSAAPPLL